MTHCVNCNAEITDDDSLLCAACRQKFEMEGDQTIIGGMDSVDGTDSAIPEMPDDPNRTVLPDDVPMQWLSARQDGTETLPPDQTKTVDSDYMPFPAASAGSSPSPSRNPRPEEQATVYDSADLHEMVKTLWQDAVVESISSGQTIKDDQPAGSSTVSRLVVKTKNFSDKPTQFDPSSADSPDYQLLRVLGEGGMGVVYEARQTSIDRDIAIKMIKPAAAGNHDVRQKFLAEAAVTGDLDHPNIVPIHDLGATKDGALFYAMKRVQGTPWAHVLSVKTFLENIDIFMNVCDAVAFAHARGVIHRDLKPENVMLGGFGEVLVMDWGLAASVSVAGKAENIRATSALGGTPAYMAPEMAMGQCNEIGPHSDIYLLGAILYEVISGRPPHSGTTVMECLYQAADNIIDPTDKQGEIVDIALKAMSAAPSDRYQDVQELQAAIKDFLAHYESINLADRARESLSAARGSRSYHDYAQALYGFEESLKLWKGNDPARIGLQQTQASYAQTALENGDLDLADSLLQFDIPEHSELIRAVDLAQREKKARRKRLKIMTFSVVMLAALILAAVSTGLFLVNREKQRVEEQKVAAENARQQAEIEQKRAVRAEASTRKALDETEKARAVIEKERNRALTAETTASKERAKAEEAFLTIAQERAKVLEAKTELTKAQEELIKAAGTVDNTLWVFEASEAKSRQQKAADDTGWPVLRTIPLGEGVNIKMVLIPSGEFVMGSPIGELNRNKTEVPHKVTISQPFYIGMYELTQAEWNRIVPTNPSRFHDTADSDNRPVENMKLDLIDTALLPALQKHAPEGMVFRLPTEAEWEYACRAGTNTVFHSGNGLSRLNNVSWFNENANRQTHTVGQKEPNAWGLFDMHGNVSEFCLDRHDPAYYLNSPEKDPYNPVGHRNSRNVLTEHIVIRGGGWINLPDHQRSAYRSWCFANRAYPFLGLRLVLSTPFKEVKDTAETAEKTE